MFCAQLRNWLCRVFNSVERSKETGSHVPVHRFLVLHPSNQYTFSQIGENQSVKSPGAKCQEKKKQLSHHRTWSLRSFQKFVLSVPQFSFNIWPLHHRDVAISLNDIKATPWVLGVSEWFKKNKLRHFSQGESAIILLLYCKGDVRRNDYLSLLGRTVGNNN